MRQRILLASLLCTLAAPVSASPFTEVGDAGALLGTAQVTTGVDPLTSISGALSIGDADLYQLFITGGGGFSATTAGGVGFDSQLFLFDSAGIGVYSNDDNSGSSAPSTLPASHPLTPLGPGLYYLLITEWNVDPVSAGGLVFLNSSPIDTDVRGPAGPGGGSPFSGYTGAAGGGLATPRGGSYTILLTGAQFAVAVAPPVPEPGSLILVVTGAIALLPRAVRRRRQSADDLGTLVHHPGVSPSQHGRAPIV